MKYIRTETTEISSKDVYEISFLKISNDNVAQNVLEHVELYSDIYILGRGVSIDTFETFVYVVLTTVQGTNEYYSVDCKYHHYLDKIFTYVGDISLDKVSEIIENISDEKCLEIVEKL